MDVENNNKNPLTGAKPDSTIRHIYNALYDGKRITSLDALGLCNTICLNRYICILRNKYGVAIKDKWLQLPNGKRVKQYWIERGA
jgi:hypothetical protein